MVFDVDADAYGGGQKADDGFGDAVDADGMVGERILEDAHRAAHEGALDGAAAAEREEDGGQQREIELVIRAENAREPGLEHQGGQWNHDVGQERIAANFEIAAGVDAQDGHGY